MMEHHFNLALGPYILAVGCNDPDLTNQFTQFYAGFIVSQAEDFSIAIQVQTGKDFPTRNVRFSDNQILLDSPGYQGKINLEEFTGELTLTSRNPFQEVDYFLRVAAAGFVYQKGGLMVHAAGIERNQQAHLFMGKSGIGKTTVARNSPPGSVMNDDLVFVVHEDPKWIVCSSPFYNPSQMPPQSHQAPLKGIYFLFQDKQVYLEEINSPTAVASFLANIPVLTTNPQMLSELFSRCNQIVQIVHPYRLHFLPDDSFWKIIP